MRRLDVASRQIGDPGSRVAAGLLLFLALSAPVQLEAQCQPTTDSSKAKSPEAQSASSATPQFYDEPQFTVAGVADTTNLGGHGSDTVVRTKSALAKDTVSLSKEAAHDSAPATGKSLEALPDLERAAQQNPGDFETAHALSLAYVNAGRYEEARTRIRALLARQDIALPNQAELHHLLGDVEENLKNPLEAVREYERAAELEPSESHLFDWGAELLGHRAPEPAVEVFAKGNRLFPRSTRMLIGLGVAWYARGLYERAVQCLCQAADLNPSDPKPYLFLSKMQNAETIQSAGFVERLARFARLQPDNALANYYYAAALRERSKGTADIAVSQQVESLLTRAVQLDPKLALAHLQLGILHSDRGDFAKAIAAYRQAIESDPRMDEPHYRLAQAYRRIGEKTKAQQEIQLYEQLSNKTREEAERERHEIQQFVFALRDQSPASVQPQR